MDLTQDAATHRVPDQLHQQHVPLPHASAFRVAELSPGSGDAPVYCKKRICDWTNLLEYEAISYAWGDPSVKEPVIIDGRRVEVTRNLHSALKHLRFEDKSRFLWADALWVVRNRPSKPFDEKIAHSINQGDIHERSQQVRQMRRIYEHATTVLIWLGPDDDTGKKAATAVDFITALSDFLSAKLDAPISSLVDIGDMYQEVIFKHRDVLPRPDRAVLDFGPDDENPVVRWQALVWFFSHPYFTRVWALQELSASRSRTLHCGRRSIAWDRVELVAGYIIMDTSFSRAAGFSGAYCWWASTGPGELVRRRREWVFLLYLATPFDATDGRDVIYGLRGLMRPADRAAAALLDPDYAKSTADVYRDSVEAALRDFETTDVLLYVRADDDDDEVRWPSWVPRWDQPMLFRNPFRFGRPMPWRPAAERDGGLDFSSSPTTGTAKGKPSWDIDREKFVLSLKGYVVGRVAATAAYSDAMFGDDHTDPGPSELAAVWEAVLRTLVSKDEGDDEEEDELPLRRDVLMAAAVSAAFGLDENSWPVVDVDGGGEEEEKDRGRTTTLLLRRFVAYLRLWLDDAAFARYVPAGVAEESRAADGRAFGKPVWDFEYPKSTMFRIEDGGEVPGGGGRVGCCMAVARPGDVVFVPLGSTYPSVLRPVTVEGGQGFSVVGFAFVHGIMYGEWDKPEARTLDIL